MKRPHTAEMELRRVRLLLGDACAEITRLDMTTITRVGLLQMLAQAEKAAERAVKPRGRRRREGRRRMRTCRVQLRAHPDRHLSRSTTTGTTVIDAFGRRSHRAGRGVRDRRWRRPHCSGGSTHSPCSLPRSCGACPRASAFATCRSCAEVVDLDALRGSRSLGACVGGCAPGRRGRSTKCKALGVTRERSGRWKRAACASSRGRRVDVRRHARPARGAARGA